MTYTQSDFLAEVGTLGFIRAVTNALNSLLPEDEEPVSEEPLEEESKHEPKPKPNKPSVSSGVNRWKEENLGGESLETS